MSVKTEIWKPIKEFENYEISNCGNVRKSGVVLNSCYNNGYKQIKLRKNGKRHAFYIHRLVAEAFIDKKENGLEVNHIDGNRSNNNVENLEWVTHKENIAHSQEVLLTIPKSNHPVIKTCCQCGRQKTSRSKLCHHCYMRNYNNKKGLECKRSKLSKDNLLQALEENAWNKSAVSKKYGVSRTTINRWIKYFEILDKKGENT